jgi:hypothetical protein
MQPAALQRGTLDNEEDLAELATAHLLVGLALTPGCRIGYRTVHLPGVLAWLHELYCVSSIEPCFDCKITR